MMQTRGSFGDLRALLHAPPTAKNVERICEWIIEGLLDEPDLIEAHLTSYHYIRELMRSWPRELKHAPTWFMLLCVELDAPCALDVFDTTCVTSEATIAFILERTHHVAIDRVELPSEPVVADTAWQTLVNAPRRVELAKFDAPASAITKGALDGIAAVSLSKKFEVSLREIASHSAQDRAGALLELALERELTDVSLHCSSDPLSIARDTSKLWARLAEHTRSPLQSITLSGIMVTSREASTLRDWFSLAAPRYLALKHLTATSSRVIRGMARGGLGGLEELTFEHVNGEYIVAFLTAMARTSALTQLQFINCECSFDGALERALHRHDGLRSVEVLARDPAQLMHVRRWSSHGRAPDYVVKMGLLGEPNAHSSLRFR